jgi:hypothetical protein
MVALTGSGSANRTSPDGFPSETSFNEAIRDHLALKQRNSAGNWASDPPS